MRNLLFTIPGFGAAREIRACVMDASSKPLPGSKIPTDIVERNDDSAGLDAVVETDGTGCAKIPGDQKVSYNVRVLSNHAVHGYMVSDSVVARS